MNRLTKLGITVTRVSDLHAKVIVIDDYLWWEGSLNTLTFGPKSLEQMRRLEGDQANEVLYKIGLD